MPTPVYSRPGVYVIEQLSGPNGGQQTTSPSNGAFAGEHWCGIPGIAYKCNSWADFVKFLGGFNSNPALVLTNPWLPFAVYMFFLNGGQSCSVQRISGTATPGTAASTTLADSSATPQTTLSLQAGALGKGGNIGSWGNSLYCDVFAMNNAPGRFGLNIYKGGTTAQFLVETWSDMSMTKTDSRYAPSILNSTTQGSFFVFATDGNDPLISPANAPAIQTGRQFAGGTDCSSPSNNDRITAMTTGSSAFDIVPGPLTINMPGEVTVTVLTAAITYAQTRPSTFLVVDPPQGLTPTSVQAFFNSLSPVSGNAAIYYPWQNASNPSTNNLTATILMPPGGIVLGQMVKTDTTKGVWWAPAGVWTNLAGVTSPERLISPTDQGTLNLAGVNVIRQRGNGQILIWGARTMQSSYASLYVPQRRTLNYIESSLKSGLENMVFAPNDAASWAQVLFICNSFLGQMFSAGAFAGVTADQSYFVICDNTNNTPQSIAQGQLNVTVGLALLTPAEFIVLLMQQFQGSVTSVQAAA